VASTTARGDASLPRTEAIAVPAQPPIAPAPATADDLYRAADAALATGDLRGAERALDRLIAGFPTSTLLDQAVYERARLAYQQRAWSTARRYLDRLAAMPHTTLAEAGHYLTCRIAVETGDGGAVACLTAYRATFPRSPHDLEALALLVKLAHASSGCAAAAASIDALVGSHPKSRHAAAWRARCPEAP
jgi:outer membrane protein assembly factor BamD (BamD/ComL family)